MNSTSNKAAERETTRRRRAAGSINQDIGKLGVNPKLLDHDKYAYRWFNDTQNGRLQMKTKHDDWDLVHGDAVKEDNTDLGSAVSIVVGANQDGTPLRAYLCRKPKTYFDEDKAAAQARLDDQLAQLSKGLDRDGGAQSDYAKSIQIG